MDQDGVDTEIPEVLSPLEKTEGARGKDTGATPHDYTQRGDDTKGEPDAVTVEMLTYASSIDNIPNLQARVAYGQARQQVVTVVMHGLPGGSLVFSPSDLATLAQNGLFIISVGMRGRDGAAGSPDLNVRELQDIRDAVTAVRDRYRQFVSPTRAAMVGYSNGGSNALCMAGRYPADFPVIVSHFAVTDYAAWYSEPFCVANPAIAALLPAWVGATPSQDPAAYAARSPLLNLEKYPGKLVFFHDRQDTTVDVSHTQRALDYLAAHGKSPTASYLSDTGSMDRFLHSMPMPLTLPYWLPLVAAL